MTDPRAPGWYDDPSGDPARLRWWDGVAWADISRARMPHEPAARPIEPLSWSAAEVLDADARPARSRGPWMAVLAALGLVGVLVLTGSFPGLDRSDRAARDGTDPSIGRGAPLPGPPTILEPSVPSLPLPTEPSPRPVSGRVVDSAAGLSYAVLPGQWRAWDLTPFVGLRATAGYYQIVQEATPEGQYWANVTSGLVAPDAVVRDDLAATARQVVDGLAASYYPKHTRRDVVQRKTTVDGKPAYLIRYLAVFDPAAAAGYQAKSEQVTVVVLDSGQDAPAVFYVSLPDTVKAAWTSVDGLIASIRILR